MGAYGALRFAPLLCDVVSVLALMPQSALPRGISSMGKPRNLWKVRFAPGIRYCVLYGEAEDEVDKAHVRRQIGDHERQRLVMVANCGPNLAPYLNEQKLLPRVLECCLRPETMAAEIEAIGSDIKASPHALERRAKQLRREQAAQLERRRKAGMGKEIQQMSETDVNKASQPAGDTLEQRFARANVTNDGRLTLDQATATMPRVAREFQAIDAQRKGYVTLDEIRAFRRTHREKQAGGGMARRGKGAKNTA